MKELLAWTQTAPARRAETARGRTCCCVSFFVLFCFCCDRRTESKTEGRRRTVNKKIETKKKRIAKKLQKATRMYPLDVFRDAPRISCALDIQARSNIERLGAQCGGLEFKPSAPQPKKRTFRCWFLAAFLFSNLFLLSWEAQALVPSRDSKQNISSYPRRDRDGDAGNDSLGKHRDLESEAKKKTEREKETIKEGK